MKLLKIRDQIINIDLLQSVNFSDDAVMLHLAGDVYRFSGDEAVVLKEWFTRYAFDLLNYQKGAERAVDQRPPVEPLRQHLPSGGLFRMPFALK